jgi:hypothetical protein
MFTALALSFVIMPSLVVGKGAEVKFELWMDNSTYHVGERLTGVFWNTTNKAEYCMVGGATGILSLTQLDTQTQASVTLDQSQLWRGSFKGAYQPAVGNPWKVADSGNWQAVLNVQNSYGCKASGSYDFQVVNP